MMRAVLQTATAMALALTLGLGAIAADIADNATCRADGATDEVQKCDVCAEEGTAEKPRQAACGTGERGRMLDHSQTRIVEPAPNTESTSPVEDVPSPSVAREIPVTREGITPPPPVTSPPVPVTQVAARPQCQSGPVSSAAPFRITVDGEPLDTAGTNEADRQRCVDVGLARSDIQVRYDPLHVEPALNAMSFSLCQFLNRQKRRIK